MNPNHDSKGRFARGSGGSSKSSASVAKKMAGRMGRATKDGLTINATAAAYQKLEPWPRKAVREKLVAAIDHGTNKLKIGTSDYGKSYAAGLIQMKGSNKSRTLALAAGKKSPPPGSSISMSMIKAAIKKERRFGPPK